MSAVTLKKKKKKFANVVALFEIPSELTREDLGTNCQGAIELSVHMHTHVHTCTCSLALV